MRASLRKRTNLVGSRWLRDGGAGEDGDSSTASMISGELQKTVNHIPDSQHTKDMSNLKKDMGGKQNATNLGANPSSFNKSNPTKIGVVIVDNKKRRTSDGLNQKHGPTENTELCLGSDDDNVDEWTKTRIKMLMFQKT